MSTVSLETKHKLFIIKGLVSSWCLFHRSSHNYKPALNVAVTRYSESQLM